MYIFRYLLYLFSSTLYFIFTSLTIQPRKNKNAVSLLHNETGVNLILF